MATGNPYLGALQSATTGLLVLDRAWRIAWVNAALAEMLAVPLEQWQGAKLWNVLPALRGHPEARAARRTKVDGQPRTFRVEYRDDRRDGVFDVRIALAPNGFLLLEVHDVSALIDSAGNGSESDVDAELLHALARAVAKARDSASILHAVGDLTMRATGAHGMIVSAVEGDRVVLLHTVGADMPPAGTSFPVAGTITERVARERVVHQEESYDPTSPMLQQLAREAAVGSLIGAPLLAYDQVVGMLAICRTKGDGPAGPRAEHKLRLMAEHVALPLWRARLLEQAQAADRAKTNFLTTMSHELRTPLTALTGYGELLADEVLGTLSTQQADAVERMRTVTHHLTVLIDEILTFVNLEEGREVVHNSCLDAREVVEEAAAIVEPPARQKAVDFRIELPDEQLRLISDGDKIRQILVNLAGNAVKFTDEGHVTLGVRRRGPDVLFVVEDTGIGIPPQAMERLFEPFDQLDGGITRRHGGTGLGLHICSRLATLLGGKIEVSSRIDHGSTFVLRLPTAALPAECER